VGEQNLPNQLWVIQINPKGRKQVPRTTAEIIDRRNEMIGNVSLFQDLHHICRVNKWLDRKAFSEEYIKQHHLQPVDIYILQMPEALQERLDYASKLDRNEQHIRELIEAGKTVGHQFVDHPESMRLDCRLFEN
jgi:NTE family protein